MFFFSVGMSLDVATLAAHPVAIFAGILGLIVVKSGVLMVLLRLFRVPWPATIETSLLLGPGGEFAFIVVGLAMTKGIIEGGMGEIVLAITSFSMALVPALDYLGRRIAGKLASKQEPNPVLAVVPPPEKVDAIVIGCGRVGTLVSEMLTRHGVKHVIVEKDPGAVARCRDEGLPVYFGDATNALFLKCCGIEQAKGVVITINKPKTVERSSAPYANCATTSSSSPARATPSTLASSTSKRFPTPCRKPSRRACSCPRQRSSGSASRPGR